jgi:DnaK suppressor protein
MHDGGTMTIAPVTSDRLAHFRQRLARREAELAGLLRQCSFAEELGDEHADFRVLAQHAILAAIEDAQASQAVAELKDIRDARRRMDAGDYGLCEECGEAIDPRRLEALPATRLCKECRSDEERLKRA